MGCYFHPNEEAEGTCAECGRFVCVQCATVQQGRCICRVCAANIILKDSVINNTVKVPSPTVHKAPAEKPPFRTTEEIPESRDYIPAPPAPIIRAQEAIPPKKQREKPKVPSIPDPDLRLSQVKTIKNPLLLFAFNRNLRSVLRIASFVIAFFMFIAIFLLPWAVGSGFGFDLTMLDGGIAAGCIIFCLLYAGATFMKYRNLRGLAHITIAFICVLLWLIFFFTTFQKISYFSMDPVDMLGYGAVLFIIVCALGVIAGAIETFLRLRRAS